MVVDADRLQCIYELIAARAEVERKLVIALVELLAEGDATHHLRKGSPQAQDNSRQSALLTVREVCERANISRVTLHRMRRKGAISFYKIGGRVLFDESHLREFLKQHHLKKKNVGD